jgi:hypothetical protein
MTAPGTVSEKILENKWPRSHGTKSRPLSIPCVIRLVLELIQLVVPFGKGSPWRLKARSVATMRRKRLSLAYRRQKELRSLAEAPLRRFLVI